MENLGIDGKLLLAQIINFVLFFILVKKFVVKPFTAFLNQERKNEEEKNSLLEKLKKSEEATLESEKRAKENMKKEFDALFIQSKKEAQNLRADLIKEAEGDAQEIRNKSKKLLEEEKKALYREVKDKIVKTSLMIVEKAFLESLDESSRKQVTNFIIKNYQGKLKVYEN
ncbi:MAG: F0F1 ATP synthase subunit B [Candidatus Roizmanbacteria bacterium GW2011_GWA2_34_18]|uniref:ATP synthase subunit b n=1 Tax=Candidatus Roizmanbacteria bacterium GW2011_GWA2_34_18 TaxID=1618477 RepID=A0A0G0AWI5_9BACT|nr:MAG: F0F1 ATP synthase subunit B [Candidatus Roizmanbacteria bacterium GW2011_GWA2_34_18]